MPKKPQTHASIDDPRLPPWLHSDTFSEEEAQNYLEAAHRCGLEVSHWARQMLNAAAREILELEDQDPRRP